MCWPACWAQPLQHSHIVSCQGTTFHGLQFKVECLRACMGACTYPELGGPAIGHIPHCTMLYHVVPLHNAIPCCIRLYHGKTRHTALYTLLTPGEGEETPRTGRNPTPSHLCSQPQMSVWTVLSVDWYFRYYFRYYCTASWVYHFPPRTAYPHHSIHKGQAEEVRFEQRGSFGA